MGERLKPAVLKTVSGVTRSGVRIPLPPPNHECPNQSSRAGASRGGFGQEIAELLELLTDAGSFSAQR
jgi:hypothetical protein